MNNGISYEEYLERNGSLTYTNIGVSMLPLLRQGRDLFTVTKKSSVRCRRGDVVLYRRLPDRYVLHRVIEVRDSDYVIMGDNCMRREYGITDDDIIGVMTAYVRNGRVHSVMECRYRLYTWGILHTIPLRVLLKKARFRLTACYRKRREP